MKNFDVRDLSSYLENPEEFIETYDKNERAGAFEYLNMRALSVILKVPLYEKGQTIEKPYYCQWHGTSDPIKMSDHASKEDGVSITDSLALVVDITRATEATQWPEFSRGATHFENFLKIYDGDPRNVFFIMPCTEISPYTFTQSKPTCGSAGKNFLPITTKHLKLLTELSKVSITFTPLEFKRLLVELKKGYDLSNSSEELNTWISRKIEERIKDFLLVEQELIYGVEFYKIKKDWKEPDISFGQIYTILLENERIRRLLGYTTSDQTTINKGLIRAGIEKHRFGLEVKRDLENDESTFRWLPFKLVGTRIADEIFNS